MRRDMSPTDSNRRPALDPARFAFDNQSMTSAVTDSTVASPTPVPDAVGRFGDFGGRYVPETLVFALNELEREYGAARHDPEFQRDLDRLLRTYVGRPSPLYVAERLTAKCGGAQIWLKREDLNHTGAHKINNTLGQALLTRR